jgi:hypothetical protein
MNNLTTLIFAVTLTSHLSICYSDEGQTDTSALIANYVSTNAGLESVVPIWKRVDHDGNSFLDGWIFHFDVYKYGTVTKLFSTPTVYFAAPVCSITPINLFDQLDHQPVFRRIGSYVILSENVNIIDNDCSNNHLYGVDISVAGKAAWSKSFPGRIYGTAIIPDLNANGVSEISVIIPTDAVPNGTNVTYYVLDGKTGAVLPTAKTYAVDR